MKLHIHLQILPPILLKIMKLPELTTNEKYHICLKVIKNIKLQNKLLLNYIYINYLNLSSSFTWGRSEEGHEYWWNIARLIKTKSET